MKGRYFKWIAILAAACVLGVVLLGATADREVYQVRQLLEKRSNIMEKTLFGEITYDEGKRQLKEVEADKLYRDDVEALTQFEDTDLERTRAMDVIELEKKSHVYDRMSFYGKIKWTISGMEGVYDEIYEYDIGVSSEDGEYRLISFEARD